MSKRKLTKERVRELFDYDHENGIFTRKTATSNCVKIGSVAGCIRPDGYIVLSVDSKSYLAHRLAWLYVYGYEPETDIDHINKNPSDNSIKNLRVVSRVCNLRNTSNRKGNKSGVKGVHFDYKNKKWFAQMTVNRRVVFLGMYVDFDDAVCARLAGEQACGWSGCDSSSPAYQYVKKNVQRG